MGKKCQGRHVDWLTKVQEIVGHLNKDDLIFVRNSLTLTFFALHISPGNSLSFFRARFPPTGRGVEDGAGDRNAISVFQSDKLTSVPAYANWEPD